MCVAAEHRLRQIGRVRRDKQHLALNFMVDHIARNMLRAAVCTQQIHIQRVFEHVLLQIFDVREAPDTGSRDKNVD